MIDLSQVQHDLKCLGFDVQRYTDWINVKINDNLEIYLMENGSSHVEARDGQADLDTMDTINLTNVLTVFKKIKMANDIKNVLNDLANKVSEATNTNINLQTVNDNANVFSQNLIVDNSWQLLMPREQKQLQADGITNSLVIKLIDRVNKLK